GRRQDRRPLAQEAGCPCIRAHQRGRRGAGQISGRLSPMPGRVGLEAVSTSPNGAPDWAAIYAEHGHAMRGAAAAKIGGPDKELFGKSADDVVGDVLAKVMVKD